MSRPLRRRLPSGKLGPPPAPKPKRKLLKTRHKVFLLVVLAIIVLAVYENNRSTHTTATTDHSDLRLVSSRSIRVAAGHAGVAEIRILNHGPDRLDDHTVTFTVTTPRHLTMTGRGTVTDDSEKPFPDSKCVPRSNGHAMRCRANISLGTSGRLLWRIPVRVDAGAPANASLRLTVSAVGSAFYVDPDAANNTKVAFTVRAGRGGATPTPRPTPTPTPTPTRTTTPSRPASPTPSRIPTSGRPTPGHTPTSGHPSSRATAGPRSGITARDVLAPVAIALWLLVGLMALAVVALVFVARRQRRQP